MQLFFARPYEKGYVAFPLFAARARPLGNFSIFTRRYIACFFAQKAERRLLGLQLFDFIDYNRKRGDFQNRKTGPSQVIIFNDCKLLSLLSQILSMRSSNFKRCFFF